MKPKNIMSSESLSLHMEVDHRFQLPNADVFKKSKRPLGSSGYLGAAGSNLDFETPRNMNPEQAAFEARTREWIRLKSLDELGEAYAEQADSFRGRVFNSNTAQEIIPGYAVNRRLYNKSTINAGRAISEGLFLRELDRVKKRGAGDTTVIIVTAGGPGSGKSSFIEGQIASAEKAMRKILVLDTTLQKKESSEQLIEKAMESGAVVRVSYIHTPVETAMRRNINRGGVHGGTNRLESAEMVGRGHFNAQRNFVEFASSDAFRKAGVVFEVFDNSVDRGNPRIVRNGVDFLNSGGIRYADEYETINRAARASRERGTQKDTGVAG